MRKIYTLVLACLLVHLSLTAQPPAPNGKLDNVGDFATKVTIPLIMPDGTKLMTDFYLPLLRDSMRLSLGKLVILGDTIYTDTITLMHVGQQIIFYDSINGQPNPDPYQLPIIFTRTPYGKGDWDQLGAVLPLFGYSYAYEDMRGAYSSEGDYFPMYSDSWNKNAYHKSGHVLDYLPPSDPKFSNRHEDGYNSLKALQTIAIPGMYNGLPHTSDRLCNGSIGMFGASALGNTQLQAGEAHRVPDSLPFLKCLMPIVATTEHYIATGYSNGVFRPGIVTGWLKGQIFSLIHDDLMPIDRDRQNAIHTSSDYNLPQSDSLNSLLIQYQQNKFDAATLSIDHFTAHRYPFPDGTLSNAGFYPNSVGRADMDASVAPVNMNGETVDSNQNALPGLTYSRYTNLDVPCFHVSGWWDIFTEGQINTLNYTIDALSSINKTRQKLVIGPWAHQTIASRKTGDREYPKNVEDITKIDLTDFSLTNLPLNQLLESDLIAWFRFGLNYNSSAYVGEPKFIIRASNEWQLLGVDTVNGSHDTLMVRAPSQDYIVTFPTMMNYFSGNGSLANIEVQVSINGPVLPPVSTSLPMNGPVLGQIGGGVINPIPYKDFDTIAPVRYYVPGPDSAADALAGYPDNYKVGNYWQGCAQFPPSDHIRWETWYLHQNGGFDKSIPTQDEGYGMYVDDPDNPILTVGGSNMIDLSPDGSTITQGQMLMSDSADAPFTMNREGVIQFNSAVIQDSFTIIGLPLCNLYGMTNPGGVTSGPTDCDWDMRVCDVWPDGRVYFVQEGIVNARARDWARALVDSMTVPGTATYVNGKEDPDDKNIPYSNINIGQIYDYTFKMLPISYAWGAGHKIRVLVSSSNYTKYQPNANLPLNDGEFFRRNPGDGQSYVYQGTEMFPRVAIQRVHFSPDNPTSISFPIFDKNYVYTANSTVVAPKLDVTIFPNPASEQIQIFANMPGEHEVDITDITGRVISTAKFDDNIIVNTSSFGKGIYMATISDVNNTGSRITRKFIVQ